MEKIFLLLHVCTQLYSLVKQLQDVVTSCNVNTNEKLEFWMAHDVLFREVKIITSIIIKK